MADEKPASESTEQSGSSPAPEELAPQADGKQDAGSDPAQAQIVTQAAKRRHAAYRPSHTATFVGLAVVALILVANGIALTFILRGQEDQQDKDSTTITLNSSTLEKLGVSRDAVGSQGVKLTINPETEFGSNVTISNDLSVGGQLRLNGRFTAPEAAFAKLQGGDTAVEKLNVNGDATASTLNLRRDLSVVGTTTLQGQVKISQLVTVNNNVNVSGSLSVGGALSVKTLSIGNLSMTGNLTFGGHIITSGSAPAVSAGSATGSNGTASGSGNDTAGTISVGVGVGSSGGAIATVSFGNGFSQTPHIVVTPVGRSVPGMYITRSSSGFTIYTPSGLAPGGYAFDYVAFQ